MSSPPRRIKDPRTVRAQRNSGVFESTRVVAAEVWGMRTNRAGPDDDAECESLFLGNEQETARFVA